jgi:hypothetical protein
MKGNSTIRIFVSEIFIAVLCLFFLTDEMHAQPAKGTSSNSAAKRDTLRPEVFTSGFFDVINNGQVNTSARLIRIYIGERGKFHFPVSVYSGLSSNNFQQSQNPPKTNDILVNNFINPVTGMANISVDGIYFRDTTSLSRIGWLYSLGERILTGYKTGNSIQPATGKPFNFPNTYGVSGLYLQTGAWERTDKENLGISWLAVRYMASYSNPKQLENVFSNLKADGLYHGYSIAAGIEINHVMNMKIVFYKYMKPPETDYGLPIYQFSFNYYLK